MSFISVFDVLGPNMIGLPVPTQQELRGSDFWPRK